MIISNFNSCSSENIYTKYHITELRLLLFFTISYCTETVRAVVRGTS